MKPYIKTAIVAIYLLLTFTRNSLWQDDGDLWLTVINQSPNKARAYNELGLHYIQQKDFNAALRTFAKSIQLGPYQPVAYINLGLAYEGLGRFDDAIEAYQRSIFVKPDDPTPYYNLGCLYYDKLKDHEKAFQFFVTARDLNPLEPDVHQYLGVIYREEGDYATAEKELQLYRKLK